MANDDNQASAVGNSQFNDHRYSNEVIMIFASISVCNSLRHIWNDDLG